MIMGRLSHCMAVAERMAAMPVKCMAMMPVPMRTLRTFGVCMVGEGVRGAGCVGGGHR
jgi:hypothetical protein